MMIVRCSTTRLLARAWPPRLPHLVVTLAAATIGGIAIGAGEASAQHLEVPIHDPVMIEQDGTYYLFGTGRSVTRYVSTDMESWERLDPVFDEAPEWAVGLFPEWGGSMWAPDIAHHDGTYYLYYSISHFGQNDSAIGLATNTTLHPDDPDYEWVDRGMVVRSIPGRDMFNAIDPNLVFDDDGIPWLTFGSFWLGIKVVQLEDDLATVAFTPEGEEWYTVAARHRYWKLHERDSGGSSNPLLDFDEIYPEWVYEYNQEGPGNGAIEAPFIFERDGYYYLFVSWDRCCRGEDSTYKVVVGRSTDIRGPYLDREDQDMRYGGGTLVIKSNENYAGIGHNSAYTFNGTDYFVSHAYDLADDGRSKLLIREMTWDDEGWPVVTLD